MDWLARYSGHFHDWHTYRDSGVNTFYRPLGLVESRFDADGLYQKGRADISLNAYFEIRCKVSKDDFRRRIILAWTCLRLQHTLLLAAATTHQSWMRRPARAGHNRYFVIQQPSGLSEAITSSEKDLVFLDDHYRSVDPFEFYRHSQNTARVVQPAESLSKVFVHPLSSTSGSTAHLRFTFILAHQISDGLTNNTWTKTLLRLLNAPLATLRKAIPDLISTVDSRLVPPQEALYPPIPGSKARQRWFWAVTVALRQVHRPNPPSFANPLRYDSPRPASLPEEQIFSAVLPYTTPPVLNGNTATAVLSPRAVRRLHVLCRASGVSVGAGAFVLVAITMMALHEQRHPDIPLDKRLPFAGSFPIDPRAFFAHTSQPDSCMLAFSDGVVLPFLPSHLDLDGRVRVLARLAQRQLSRYQKRAWRTAATAAIVPTGAAPSESKAAERAAALHYWGASGPGRVIAMNYINAVEAGDPSFPSHLKKGIPPAVALTERQIPKATCGVSSVGRGDPGLRPGRYDLDVDIGAGEDAFVADIRGLKMGVRPRDGEFLVGVGGTDDTFGAGVSYDACAIDESRVERWKELMETILEPEQKRPML